MRPDRRFDDRPRSSNDTAGGRRRNLSQNFLVDAKAIASFLDACRLTEADRAVEIGAGAGALTPLIATRVAALTAYEADAALAPQLDRAVAGLPNVAVEYADALAVRVPAGTDTVLGNIPFGRTAEVIRWTLDQDVRSASYITQLEYARKRTGHRDRWSQLTVATWPWLAWTLGPRISRTAFRPVPAVDAAVLMLDFRPEPLLSAAQLDTYREIVALGFTGVGGTLFASLQARFRPGLLTAAFDRAGLDRDVVVAFADPAAWLVLAAELTQPGQPRRTAQPGRPGRSAQPGRPARSAQPRRAHRRPR